MAELQKEGAKEAKEQKAESKKEEQKKEEKKPEIRINQKKETSHQKKEKIERKIKKELEGEKQKLLQMSEISLWLDTYEDIFSDFDPRPYSQRALSDDFLQEAKRASKEKATGQVELKFLIPRQMRNFELENIIKKRLRDHFKKHYNMIRQEIKNARKKGVILVIVGVAVSLSAAYLTSLEPESPLLVLFSLKPDAFILKFLFALLEPAGWFTIWNGLDQIYSTPSVKKADVEFYEKMSKSEIMFLSY